MATDIAGASGPKGPDVLVSTVTALTASGAWVTWSGYRAASRQSGRPDYYISTLPSSGTSSTYNLIQIGAQAPASAEVQLTVLALGAGGAAELAAPNGSVIALTEGVAVSVPGGAGGAYRLTFTGSSCTLQVVRPTTSGDSTLEDDEGEPPPPYPGGGGGN